MRKLKKTLLISVIVIITTAILVIVFISPITKYLIEKYDEKYTGRQITIGWAYVNPFTGYVRFNNLKIYEEKSDTLFFSANSLSANIEMFKLISKTYELSEITLDHPRGMIIQNKNIFNFTDIIERFSSKNETPVPKSPLHFNILGIKIIDGEFYYNETLVPVNYFIKNVNIESKGKQWDSDTMATVISFQSGIGKGDVKGTFNTNFKTGKYSLTALVNKFDLGILGQYLKDLTNYGTFSANLDADVRATGNFNDKEDLTARGIIAINEFHFGKTIKDDYGSFQKLVVAIDELSPKKHIYLIDSGSVQHPYFKFERYENNSDNIQTMFGKHGANVTLANANPEKFNLLIEIAKYVKILAKNFFKSNYKINRLAIYNGDFKYNDYTLNEKFSVDANPIYAIADSINKNKQWVKAYFKTGIKPYGNAIVTLGINPKDSSDFDVTYQITKVNAAMSNPLLISYTSFPLDRGTLQLKGSWNVRSNIINSNNHLLIIDPRLNNRLKNDNTSWVPMKILMFFVREKGNVIDYDIPITGNLKDPKFHLKSAIFQVLTNVFVKPATAAYRTEVKNVETEIEKSLSLKWEMRDAVLSRNQEKFIEQMADFLSENPAASITVSPQLYSAKEKEYILFFEAKKKYFLLTSKKPFTENDSDKVNKMSIKDSIFVRYLNKQVNDTMMYFTIQEKCEAVVNAALLDTRLNELNKVRKNIFLSFFKDNDLNVEKRIHFTTNETVIPYNGFSFYKIDYKGEFPERLMKAYRRMNELNNESPRKEFVTERKKNKNR